MPNKAYRHGYAFELRVKKYLQSSGFYVVRSSGSHGTADLVAMRWTIPNIQETYLIQCKAGKGYISRAEQATLFTSAEVAGGYAILCTRNEKNRIVFEWIKNKTLVKKKLNIK